MEDASHYFRTCTWAENKVSLRGNVAVIGDGNSAFETARTLVRLGAQVTLISWFPRALIPADALEVEEALSEGVSVKTSLKVDSFLGDGGRLKAIRFVPTIPGPPDAKGIPWPVRVEGGKPIEIEFERAVIAIGQTGNPDLLDGMRKLRHAGRTHPGGRQRKHLHRKCLCRRRRGDRTVDGRIGNGLRPRGCFRPFTVF